MKCCSGTLLAIFVALSSNGCVAEEKGQTTTPLGAPYVLGDTSYPAYWLRVRRLLAGLADETAQQYLQLARVKWNFG